MSPTECTSGMVVFSYSTHIVLTHSFEHVKGVTYHSGEEHGQWKITEAFGQRSRHDLSTSVLLILFDRKGLKRQGLPGPVRLDEALASAWPYKGQFFVSSSSSSLLPILSNKQGKMTVKLSKAEKKVVYDKKLCSLLDEHTRVLIAVADNVGSNQLQNIRKGLRGDSIVLMGKNTLIRRCIRIHAEKTGNKNYLNLLPLLVVTFYFFSVLIFQVGAPARVGLVAPIDVVVPPGNTGLDPSQTSFFQVLNIPTKINKGTVEIITPVELIKKGEKVGSSEAALLAKLGIRPFSYGLVILSVYENGSVFSPEVLDLTEEDLIEKFAAGVSMVTSLSLAVSYPTLAAAPHMFINAYKNVLAVAIATEYTFPQAEKVKEYLKDPSKFAVAAPVVAAEAGAAPAAEPAEEKKEEPAEESDDDMGFSLFD
ncbi:hypothetical protein B296_00031516 [Ensete ventricosum]|uniref:Large ribosomal subunit protein uL10-like insertion domain-containing protein n=1 Tax=Ensete ventricosum TaxID=4639 RepID=A0A427AFZ9_ENSVE|nr:hypothetical protein B296_00031516 [Ensete ventricosum]